MKEIKMFTPVKSRRRGFWSLCLLGVILLAASSWIQYRKAADLVDSPLLERRRRALEGAAASLGEKRSALQLRLVALAEQKSLREGVMKLQRADVSSRWREGFLQAMDAVCRSKVAEEPVFRECSLRDLEGNKWAGTGAVFDSVRYPDILERVRTEVLPPSPSAGYRERWIVPVRDAKAQPLAYLTAVVSFTSGAWLPPLVATNGEARFFLTDASGALITGDDDLFRDLRAEGFPRRVNVAGNTFDLMYAAVPASPWTLYLAFPETTMERDLRSLGRLALALFAVAALVLVIFTFRLTARRE